MRLFPLLGSLSVSVAGQEVEWLDPFDMINYDASTKTMRRTPEGPPQEDSCSSALNFSIQQIEELQKQIGTLVLILTIFLTRRPSVGSWLVRFTKTLAFYFFVRALWNWMNLYKVAFIEHQSNITKMENFHETCRERIQIDWTESLKEWIGAAQTVEDDPCKDVFAALIVSPIRLVPPHQALLFTTRTFTKDPIRHFGLATSELFQLLLNYLPVSPPVFIIILLLVLIVKHGCLQEPFFNGVVAPERPPEDAAKPERKQTPSVPAQVNQRVPNNTLSRKKVSPASPDRVPNDPETISAELRSSEAKPKSSASGDQAGGKKRAESEKTDDSTQQPRSIDILLDFSLTKNEPEAKENDSQAAPDVPTHPSQDPEASVEGETTSDLQEKEETEKLPVQETCPQEED